MTSLDIDLKFSQYVSNWSTRGYSKFRGDPPRFTRVICEKPMEGPFDRPYKCEVVTITFNTLDLINFIQTPDNFKMMSGQESSSYGIICLFTILCLLCNLPYLVHLFCFLVNTSVFHVFTSAHCCLTIYTVALGSVMQGHTWWGQFHDFFQGQFSHYYSVSYGFGASGTLLAQSKRDSTSTFKFSTYKKKTQQMISHQACVKISQGHLIDHFPRISNFYLGSGLRHFGMSQLILTMIYSFWSTC